MGALEGMNQTAIHHLISNVYTELVNLFPSFAASCCPVSTETNSVQWSWNMHSCMLCGAFASGTWTTFKSNSLC
uniref:Uncharacterized protein n=1 Tax=Trichobilharzia regenti TaxID=157069 RepID=A0AA85K2L1_TRIRE|nr:unnamed protein product [Trichobilharzia regenti]